MSRILLALVILTAGTGGFLAAHYETTQLTRELNAHRDAWLAQTQQLAAVQAEQADLAERMRQLKVGLGQSQPVAENALWSALRTNRADRLPQELRERVLEELGFNWQFSPDFIVVTKKALRETREWNLKDRTSSGGWMLKDGKLSEMTVSVLALTPEERGKIEVAMQHGQAEFDDWALARIKRSEPKGNVVASYALAGDRAQWAGVSNNLALAVGSERTDLILDISREQLASDLGVTPGQITITLTRELVGSPPRLQAQIATSGMIRLGYLPDFAFPDAFRPIFTNGWADVAKREGFELPEQPQGK
jgi:hypothetical protein